MSIRHNIRFILVRTSHSGNIGGAARALKTMGMSQLYLVTPNVQPDGHSRAMSANADDILDGAIFCSSLAEALEDCCLVIATTARARRLPLPQITIRQMAKKVVQQATSAPVAILFGNEKNGLSNAELDACQLQMAIPAHDVYPVLNLAAAVQIVCYELYMALQNTEHLHFVKEHVLAPQQVYFAFFDHLKRTLQQIEFFNDKTPNVQRWRRLLRIFNRAELNESEVHLLQGILTRIDQYTDHH